MRFLDFLVAIIGAVGVFIIFNGLLLTPDTSIHEIYVQLIILTGVLMLTLSIISAILLRIYTLLKQRIDNKNIRGENE